MHSAYAGGSSPFSYNSWERRSSLSGGSRSVGREAKVVTGGDDIDTCDAGNGDAYADYGKADADSGRFENTVFILVN